MAAIRKITDYTKTLNNIYLQSESLGLATVAIGAFIDKGVISDPSKYIGIVSKKTEEITKFWEKQFGI